MKRILLALCVCWLAAGSLSARESIRLAKTPALSPDGALLAFEWNGDIWVASSQGGEARQLTTHPGKDAQPKFSPDGKEIAFVSDREGGAQVFVVPVTGGSPQQVTFHTAGHELQEWTPDGKSLLVKGVRDHFWRHGERFFTVPRAERGPEKLLFDDFGADGVLSADGRKILFTREGEPWWRKGYHGPRAPQLWMHDLGAKQFTKLVHKDFGSRWPLWKPDTTGFYFVQEHAKGSNLCSFDLANNATTPLTDFKEEAVVFPCVARDGSALVFRHLFDLYRLNPSTKELKKLDLWHSTDRPRAKQDRRVLTSATAVAFSQDGLEIAFIAGGDLWVMDTELREPVQITKTAEEETFPVFASDTLYFVSGAGGKHAIWKAVRKDAKKFWWQNAAFDLAKLTTFDDVPSQLKLSPDGKTLAYVRGRGDLHLLDLETNKDTKLCASWSSPDYAWSPDGKWIVHSQNDSEFNLDVWVRPVDGSRKPYNLSRHPYNEGRPAWSPDGRWIAFAGQRASGDPGANVCIVALREDEDEKTERDRKLEKALEKMKGRTGGAGKFPKVGEEGKLPEKKAVEVVIDFDRLHERVKRVTLTDGSAGSLFWSPDSKKLAFTGSFEGKPGTYTIDMGEKLTPKQLTATVGQQPVWLRQGSQIVWLVGGVPTSTSGVAAPAVTTTAPTPAPATTPIPKKGGGGFRPGGAGGDTPATAGAFPFSVRQEIDVPARHAAIFDTCWRIMRDNWYDSNLGNSDWNAVRAKYRDMASQSPDMEGVSTVVQLMLGELNGSHLGFTAMSAADLPGLGGVVPKTAAVRDVTGHLGVRFDLAQPGPGLKIRDVLAGGPADKKRSKLRTGETILRIDGTPVGPDSDLAKLLTRPADREVELVVKDAKREERTVNLAPTTYAAAQQLLYDHWLRHNRQKVDELSGGKLGYLHISAMSMPSFRKFEEELVSEGSGRDGLVIDVRENGGGSTTDHLLTALTQPVHAITVPRGGGPGYPHDRKVYMTWSKPIIVLCNQNSYSNAEIFSHAVKNLKRGQVVGVPTAGGVVSTGVAPVMDVGTLRLPTRGWFLVTDGKDMELNGCVPHHVLWPQPGEMPRGSDAQLSRAVEVLLGDEQAWSQRPQPKLRRTTEAP